MELTAVALGEGWDVGGASSVVPSPGGPEPHPPDVQACTMIPYTVKGLRPDTTAAS